MAKSHIRIRRWDWILILGIVLAPMTGLRIWKVGPGECLCLLWCFPRLTRGSKIVSLTVIFKVFVGFLASLLVGTIIGSIVAPEERVLSDWFTWIYLFLIATSLYQQLSNCSSEYIHLLIEASLRLSVVWYMLLFLYSRIISRTFLSAPLWYGGVRYTGGATNPHQIAMMLCIAILYFGILAIEKKNVIECLFTGCAVFMLIQTKATTGYAAVVLGLVVYFGTRLLEIKKGKKDRWNLLIVYSVFALVIVALNWELVMRLLMEFMNSDKNGSSRLIIFSNIGNTLSKSPIFGLGPGTHSFWPGVGMMEYHNTFLEVLADAGIIGEIVLLWFILRMIKASMIEPKYLSMFITILVYCAAGFIMRRLIFWTYISLFLVYLKNKEDIAVI